MRPALLCALVAAFLGLGCSSSPGRPDVPAAPLEPKPDWLANHPQDPGYPPAAYLVGLGGAKVEGDRGQAHGLAVEGARADLSRGIRTRIRSVLETYENTLARSGLVRSTSEFTQKIESATDLDLPGVETVRQWHDPADDYIHVKVAVHRGKFAAILAREVQEQLARAKGLEPLAERAPAARLRALLGAYSELTRASGRLAVLQVVSPGSQPELQAIVNEHLPAVTNALLEFLDTVRLHVLSGSGQEGFAGGRLSEPIVIEASGAGTPLANVPLEFLPRVPGAARVVPAQGGVTDAAGRVSFELTELVLTGLVENELTVRLALSRFAPEWPADQGPSTVALYLLPTLKASRFALALEESLLERPAAEPVVAGKVAEMLGAKGVRLLALDRISASWRASDFIDLSVAEARRRLEGEIDYLIRGRVRAIAGERTAAGISFAFAGGTVEMIDIRRGDQVTRVDIPPNDQDTKAAARTFPAAGLGALRKLADKVAQDLEKRLDERFPR